VDEEAEGRRRRGLILAGIVLVVGVPLTVTTWLSERNVDQQATELADDLRRAGRQVDDVAALTGDETLDGWDGNLDRPVAEALGHGDALAGVATFGDGISAAYEVRWGLATRCVHLLLRNDAPVRTEVTDSATCRPLPIE
jgi:hypothetical protein